MKTYPPLPQLILPALLVTLVILASCASNAPSETEQGPSAALEAGSVVLLNQGGEMEGHTPRGFQGMGTGLFAGDNLNPNFPEGDGTQIFLTFDLGALPEGEISSATLSADAGNVRVKGAPFEDLGSLLADEVRYEIFSSALWDLQPEPDGLQCEFAVSLDGPFACDVSEAVRRSAEAGYPYAQFRLRLTEAGDNDGVQDMVFFLVSDPNANEPGLFELEVTFRSSE